jgi:probable HAF family extracellular repeat protein
MVVGSYDGRNGFHGFIYNPNGATFTTLDDPAAFFGTFASGINDRGQIVGSYFDSVDDQHGFLYSGGFYTTIDDPLATNGTIVQGINDAGQIVGLYSDDSGTHGFLATVGANPAAPPGTTADMVLRASNTSPIAGQYEIYDIGSNSILAGYSLGQVGTDWGFVTLGLGSTSQLVQAMAGFGGGSGASDNLKTAALGADTSQQLLLTTPQHV